MVKGDLVDALAGAFPGVSKRDLTTIVDTLFEGMAQALDRGEAVDLRGFGRLTVRKRRPITGRNPRTAVPVDVPVRWVVHFKPGNGLAQRLKPKEQDAVT